MNYYKRHIGDYIRDTSHLSLLEHGVYARFLDLYYTTEAGIPDDRAERLVGARTQEERDAARAVLSEFFRLEDGSWKHDRCERELAAAREKAKQSQENGGKGGRPPKPEPTPNQEETQTVSDDNPDITLSTTPLATTPLAKQKTISDFESWWTEYPLKKGKGQARKAFFAALGKPGVELSILTDGARRYRQETRGTDPKFIKHPSTWLNGECWADEEHTTATAKPGNMLAANLSRVDAEIFAERIRKNSAIGKSRITEPIAQILMKHGMVTAEQVRTFGLSVSHETSEAA